MAEERTWHPSCLCLSLLKARWAGAFYSQMKFAPHPITHWIHKSSIRVSATTRNFINNAVCPQMSQKKNCWILLKVYTALLCTSSTAARSPARYFKSSHLVLEQINYSAVPCLEGNWVWKWRFAFMFGLSPEIRMSDGRVRAGRSGHIFHWIKTTRKKSAVLDLK